jgi:hypothetical protein
MIVDPSLSILSKTNQELSRMNQDSTHTDNTDIFISVTLSTGETIPGVNCSLLRVFKDEDSRNAHALIHYHIINNIRTNDDIKIEPTSYVSFQDEDGYEWIILDFEENTPPEPPGLIFRLLASI